MSELMMIIGGRFGCVVGVALLGYPVVDVIVHLVLHIDIEYLLPRSLPLLV
jgi:hypothetical protein